ncbi:MAG: hypothetical protein OZ923_01660 [Comamonadaceae bacterium]|nr:hypothetical protein [Comamonadaceae bacterium]
MQTIPVSSIDPYDEGVLLDPYPYYSELRDLGPVVSLERYGVYAVARHQEVEYVLRNHGIFCSSAGVGLANFRTDKPWRKPSIILEADPPLHDKTRKLLGGLLAPASIKQFKEDFERYADLLVDRIIEQGLVNAVHSLCIAYPIKVFADAVGVPEDGRELLMTYGDMVFNGFGPFNKRFEERMATAGEAIAWVTENCKREKLRSGSLGERVWQAADRGEIEMDEAPMLVRTLLSASLDTTAFMLCNIRVPL